MVKQRITGDGTVAMDCGVCVIAMLTDLPYEKVLASALTVVEQSFSRQKKAVSS